jgi:hypothetical protein
MSAIIFNIVIFICIVLYLIFKKDYYYGVKTTHYKEHGYKIHISARRGWTEVVDEELYAKYLQKKYDEVLK